MRTRGHTIVKITLSLVVIVLLAGYGLFQARQLIQGPVVVIESPRNGALMHSGLINIEGRVDNISDISLNDRKIYVNEQGQFEESVVLSRGMNTIMVEGQDRFGRETQDTVQLMYNPLNQNGDQLSRQSPPQLGPEL